MRQSISKCVLLLFVRGRHYGAERAIRWDLPRISSLLYCGTLFLAVCVYFLYFIFSLYFLIFIYRVQSILLLLLHCNISSQTAL